MARLLPILLVVGLLGGTAAAFAITEGLKLEKSPIYGTHVDKLFSPTCNCLKDVAHVSFKLRKGDTMTATVDHAGRRARNDDRQPLFPPRASYRPFSGTGATRRATSFPTGRTSSGSI